MLEAEEEPVLEEEPVVEEEPAVEEEPVVEEEALTEEEGIMLLGSTLDPETEEVERATPWNDGPVINTPAVQTAANTVYFAWYQNTSATGYQVTEVVNGAEQSVTGLSITTFTMDDGTPVCEAVITGVSSGEHTYRIRPVNGETVGGDFLETMVTIAAVPSAPVLKITQSTKAEGRLELTWTIKSTTNLVSYELDEVVDASGSEAERGTYAKKLKKATLNNVDPGTHTYVLYALSANGVAVPSAQVTVTVSALWSFAPGSVKAKQASSGDTTVTVSWKKKYATPKYWNIYEDGQLLATVDGSKTSYSRVGATVGTHVYSVAGTDGTEAGQATAAKSLNVKVGWLTSSGKPKVTAVQETKVEHRVTLTVKSSSAAPKYNIYAIVNGEAQLLTTVKGGKTVKVTLDNQAEGVRTYVAEPTNDVGQTGTLSNETSITVLPLWGYSVTRLKAKAVKNSGAVSLSWKAAYTKADGYNVYVYDADGNLLHTLHTTSLSLTTPALENGTYTFRVQAESNGQESDSYSQTKLKVNVAWKKAPTLTLSQDRTKSGAVTVTVKPGATNKSAHYVLTVDGQQAATFSGKTYTVTGLSEGTHTFSVVYATSAEASEASKTTSLDVLPACMFAVTGLKAVQTEDLEVTLTGKPVATADGVQYEITATTGKSSKTTVADNLDSVKVAVAAKGKCTITVRPFQTVNGSKRYGDSASVKVSVQGNWWKRAVTISSVKQTANDQVTITFTGMKGADRYVVYDTYNRTTSVVATAQNDSASPLTYIVIPNVAAGKHEYAVQAQQVSGSKVTSGVKTSKQAITVKGELTELTAASDLKGTFNESSQQVTLTWTSLTASASFKVYDYMGGTEVTGATIKISHDGTAWTAVLTDLQNGTHTFGVAPYVTSAGGTSYGTAVSTDAIQVVLTGLRKPENIKAVTDDSTNTITLSWSFGDTKSTNVVVYVDGTEKMTLSGETTCSFTVSGKGCYSIQMAARRASDKLTGELTDVVEACIYDAQEMAAPTQLCITDGVMSWTAANQKATTYHVYEQQSGGDVLLATVTGTSYTLPEENLGTVTYYVKAVSLIDENHWKEGSASATASNTVSKVVVDGLTYEMNANTPTTCSVTACSNTSATITIPGTMGSCTVTAIAADAFKSNSTLVTITIPSSVTKIGARAFKACKKLTTMNIAN